MTANREEVTIVDERLQKLLAMTGELSDRFKERAAWVDREGVFPYENFQELKDAGYLALTLPEEYGGANISLYEMVVLQERLAEGDAATALGIGWHLCVMMEMTVLRPWKEEAFAELCRQVVHDKVLVNKAATEPATGSPTRGGRPQTKAKKIDGGWLIDGRKTYTSMGEALGCILITAAIEGTDEIGEFQFPGTTAGVRFEPTWDTLGMRGTRSDDLVMEQVVLPEEALVKLFTPGAPSSPNRSSAGWLLHIPACYLGIAKAARDYAVQFAVEYSPNSTTGPIKNLPNVQRLIGQMDLELIAARHFLHSVARQWDQPELRPRLGAELAAAKHAVTNSAISVVDLAMRLVGGHSLYRSRPLERHYRDVRAGLYNPPMDDITIQILANRALKEYE